MSKRAATKPGKINMGPGPEHRRPSWQTGTAHSSLSSASSSSSFSATAPSKSDLESAVAGLLDIKRGNPKHERAIDCAVQLMTDQEFTFDFLYTALVDVRIKLRELLVDLDLNEEVSEAIKAMQGGILAILDLLDVGDGVLEPAGGAPSASASSQRKT